MNQTPTLKMVAGVAFLLCVYTTFTQATFFSFTPRHGKTPTILMEVDFSINIKAIQEGKEVGSYTLDTSQAKDITITGVSGQRSFIYLRFGNSVSWAFIFFEESPTEVTMDRLVQMVPSEIFPEITTLSNSDTFESPGIIDLQSSSNSFACNHEIVEEYKPRNVEEGDTNFTVSVTVRNFKVQAYNVKEGNFSPSVQCAEDSLTTTTTTSRPSTTPLTTTPATTIPRPTPSPAAKNTYIVKKPSGLVCIAMVTKLKFNITYEAKPDGKPAQNKTVTVGVPADATSAGDCDLAPRQQSLTIVFSDAWVITIIFKLHNIISSSWESQEHLDYSISEISLRYSMNHDIFPNAVEPEGTRHVVGTTVEDDKKLPEKKAGQAYFQCNSGTNHKLGENVEMQFSYLKFKAFNEDHSHKFDGMPGECEADKASSTDWLSIFGWILLAFFLLLLLLVIIFVVYRGVTAGYRAI